MRHIHRIGAAVLAVTALVACNNGNNNANGNPSESAAALGPAPTDTSHANATATPDSMAANANAAMTDSTILGAELGGDSAEVQLGKYMEANATNAGVKSFARLLVSDHTSGMSQVKSAAKAASLTPQPPANDTTAQETSDELNTLKSLSGKDRDTAFVNHEVTDHQSDIAKAQQMEQQAQSPQVKSLLQKTLPVLQKHLDRAQKLQTQLSGSAST